MDAPDMTQVNLPSVAHGVGRGFTVMLVGGLLVVALSGVLQAATGGVLTLMAIAAFASAAWDVPTPTEGALTGAGTYLLFLPLAFLGQGDPPGIAVLVPLLAAAAVVGGVVSWIRHRG